MKFTLSCSFVAKEEGGGGGGGGGSPAGEKMEGKAQHGGKSAAERRKFTAII